MKTESILAPCSPFDVEKMQTWLEDMARAGYLLKKASRLVNAFQFYRISPLNVRYRITPASSNTEFWNNAPNDAHKALSEEFGWEYVCSDSGLHIYRCYSDEVRELNTDPQVLEDALRLLHRRVFRLSLWMILRPIVYIALLFLLFRGNNFWQNMIREINFFYTMLPMAALFLCVHNIPRCIQMRKLCRQLSEGRLLTERKPWKKHAAFARAGYRFWMITAIAIALSFSMIRQTYNGRMHLQHLPAAGTPMPFVTIADLGAECPDAELQRNDSGFYRSWDHPLSPVNYEWSEFNDVIMPDGITGMVSMDLSYHQLRWPWLAECLAEEYVRNSQKSGTPAEVPDGLPLDFAYYFLNRYGDPGAVLRNGSTVIRITFHQENLEDSCLQLSHWIDCMLPLITEP